MLISLLKFSSLAIQVVEESKEPCNLAEVSFNARHAWEVCTDQFVHVLPAQTVGNWPQVRKLSMESHVGTVITMR